MTEAPKETVRGIREDPRHPWRNHNLGRLLLTALKCWQDELVAALRQSGFEDITATHMNLLRYIDLTGTRVTEIAERADITKQAVGQLVAVCIAHDLLMTWPDPNDRRAKIVAFTKKGEALILAELDLMKQLDSRLDAILEPDNYRHLRDMLSKIPQELLKH